MIEMLLWGAVGMFIGWNFPQPTWAANLQSKISGFFMGRK